MCWRVAWLACPVYQCSPFQRRIAVSVRIPPMLSTLPGERMRRRPGLLIQMTAGLQTISQRCSTGYGRRMHHLTNNCRQFGMPKHASTNNSNRCVVNWENPAKSWQACTRKPVLTQNSWRCCVASSENPGKSWAPITRRKMRQLRRAGCFRNNIMRCRKNSPGRPHRMSRQSGSYRSNWTNYMTRPVIMMASTRR